jgi:hypothetical protein
MPDKPDSNAPIETAKQLFGAKFQSRWLVRAFGRCVAPDSVAVDDIDLAPIEPRSGFPRSSPGVES